MLVAVLWSLSRSGFSVCRVVFGLPSKVCGPSPARDHVVAHGSFCVQVWTDYFVGNMLSRSILTDYWPFREFRLYYRRNKREEKRSVLSPLKMYFNSIKVF